MTEDKLLGQSSDKFSMNLSLKSRALVSLTLYESDPRQMCLNICSRALGKLPRLL